MWRLAYQRSTRSSPTAASSSSAPRASRSPMLVVAELLGVPESDHRRFREGFGLSCAPSEVGAGPEGDVGLNPLDWLDDWFAEYVEDRRRAPRHDLITALALATYPDGTTLDVIDESCSRLHSGSSPATRRPDAAHRLRSATSPSSPSCGRAAARTRITSRDSSRRRSASRAREDRLPPRRARDVGRRRRHRGRDAGHAARRLGEPRSSVGTNARPSPHRPPPTPSRTSRSGTASTSVPGGPLARAEGRVASTHPRPDARHPALRGGRRPTGATAASSHADLGAARLRPSCTSSSLRYPRLLGRGARRAAPASGPCPTGSAGARRRARRPSGP